MFRVFFVFVGECSIEGKAFRGFASQQLLFVSCLLHTIYIILAVSSCICVFHSFIYNGDRGEHSNCCYMFVELVACLLLYSFVI